MKLTLASISVALALSLAGCKQHDATGGPSDAPAEVLPGSASDAMIAYDKLRSQPPLVGPTQDAAHHIGNGPKSDDDATEPATEPSSAAAAPAASATQVPPAG